MPSDIIGPNWTERQESAFGWAEFLLESFTYKVGWHFDMTRDPDAGPRVRIAFRALNTRFDEDPTMPREVPVTGLFSMPDHFIRGGRREHLFWEWLLQCVVFVETHEAQEWFKVDDEIRFDPHSGFHNPMSRDDLKRALEEDVG